MPLPTIGRSGTTVGRSSLLPAIVRSGSVSADSPSRTRDSVIVTGALGLLLVGAPLKLFSRVLDVRSAVDAGSSPFAALAPTDIVWLSLIALWILAVQQLVRRTALPADSRLAPHGMQSAARGLVELSMFGAGPLLGWTSVNPEVGLDRLETPGPSIPTDDDPVGGGFDQRPAVATTLVPIVAPPAKPRAERTRDHIIERGDTFWSLAETTYGDGRQWQKIRDLNLGREVAPDVVMNERSDLAAGWSVLLPDIRRKEVNEDDDS